MVQFPSKKHEGQPLSRAQPWPGQQICVSAPQPGLLAQLTQKFPLQSADVSQVGQSPASAAEGSRITKASAADAK